MPLVPNDTDGAISRSRIQSYVTAKEKVTAVAITDAAEPTAATITTASK